MKTRQPIAGKLFHLISNYKFMKNKSRTASDTIYISSHNWLSKILAHTASFLKIELHSNVKIK
jgi:hypothetical protein